MEKVRVEITVCPKCRVTCVVGSDEDFQEFCACCMSSFKIEKTYEVTDEEYLQMKNTAKEKYFAGPWVAFKP